MKNQHSVHVTTSFLIIALALVASLGFWACSNGLLGNANNAGSFPVSVTWNGGGVASARTTAFTDGLVNSVFVIVYSSATGERTGSGSLTRTPATSNWRGDITVSENASAVFEANALNYTGSVLYVGRHTQTLTGSGDQVTIPVGAAGVKGGSIQGQVPDLSTMVNTFAGTKGTQGATPGTGTAALFTNPYGITTDGTNLYLADFASCQISKIVIATQVVTDFAGHFGTGGRTEGVGAAAYFNTPRGMTLVKTDIGVDIYVCDYGNNSIRKITFDAGAGTATVSSFAGTLGAVDGAVEGTGDAATFHSPSGITYYDGNLYVTDTFNNKIRKIVVSTTEVTTIAGQSGVVSSAAFIDGTGVNARFNQPQGITNDGTYLYVADTVNHSIRRIVITTGVTDTIAGTGAAGLVDGNGTVAQFSSPIGITTDGTYLYVADSVNHNIRKITPGTTAALTTVATLAGSTGSTPGTADGYGTAAKFNNPYGITTDGTNLYVAEYTNYDIRKIQ